MARVPLYPCSAPAREALHHAANGSPEEFKQLFVSSVLDFGLFEVCNENVWHYDKFCSSLSVNNGPDMQQHGVAGTRH